MPLQLVLVFIGGAVGTLSRYGMDAAIGPAGDVPLSTFIVNVGGSLALGILVGTGVGHRSRLLLGAGFLGGFTTYSAFAVQTDLLLRDDNWIVGAGYPIVSVTAGVLAAIAGLRLGRGTG